MIAVELTVTLNLTWHLHVFNNYPAKSRGISPDT